ncbi:MAG: hypothetical protein CME82_00335 [Halomonas sp.]|nr:hypothetical protein [Halomonas sp.]
MTAVVLARGWPTRNELALSRWTFHTVRAVMEASSTGIRCLQGSYQGAAGQQNRDAHGQLQYLLNIAAVDVEDQVAVDGRFLTDSG